MRLRNVKDAFERIDDFEALIKEPTSHKGAWQAVFNNNHPISIEIGMGKGQFLIEQARRHPDRNFIGFEKFTVVLVKALEKIEKEGNLPNLKVVRFDAAHLKDIFGENEISQVYLNFSDPWPKERHYKRRLTYRDFLKTYQHVLREDGALVFKTDNRPLFDFSLEEMKAIGMTLNKVTFDLHKSQWLEGNIMTEYETKFHEQGLPIHMVEAVY